MISASYSLEDLLSFTSDLSNKSVGKNTTKTSNLKITLDDSLTGYSWNGPPSGHIILDNMVWKNKTVIVTTELWVKSGLLEYDLSSDWQVWLNHAQVKKKKKKKYIYNTLSKHVICLWSAVLEAIEKSQCK